MEISHEITIFYRDGTKEMETVDASYVENGCLVIRTDPKYFSKTPYKDAGHRYIPLDIIKEWRTDV